MSAVSGFSAVNGEGLAVSELSAVNEGCLPEIIIGLTANSLFLEVIQQAQKQ